MAISKMNRLLWSFDRRLGWVVAGVFPLLLFGLLMLLMFTGQQEHAIEDDLRDAAAGAALLVDRAVGEQLGIMYGMAASLAFDRGDLETLRLEAERLWALHPEWRTVIVTDEHRSLMNLRDRPGEPRTPLRDPRSLAQVWSTGRPVVGDLVHGYVGFRVPVAPAGKVTHTIAVPVAPRFFRDILSKHALYQPWSVAVIDSDKVVIASTPEAPIVEGVPLPSNLQLPDGKFGKSGSDYLAWDPVGQSGWTVLVIAPAAAVEKPFTKVRTALVVGGSLSAALTAVLVMILSSAWAARRETSELKSEVAERRRAEEELTGALGALRAGEERLRAFSAATFEGIVFSEAGRILDCNDQFARIMGFERDELIGTDLSRLVVPEVRPHVRQNFATNREDVIEHEAIRKDGSHITVEAHGRPVQPGSSLRCTAVRDISERKRIELALRESEERFRRMAENAYEGIWTIDSEQRVAFANQRMADILGWSIDEMVGRPAMDFIHPDDLADHRFKMEERRRGERANYERRMRHRDGRAVWVMVSAVPIMDAEGEFEGSFGMFTDITERKAGEAALRESEERYRRVVDLVPDAISIFVDERFAFTNRSGLEMVGAENLDELRGRPIWDICHPSYVPLGRARFQKCLTEGKPLPPVEFELLGLGGASITVESSAVPITYQGAPALLTVWRDVTSRKKALIALRENEELFRGTFDLSPVGQTMTDLDYHFIRCNEAFCRLLGYTEPELIGRSLFEITHPDDRQGRSVSHDLITRKTERARFQKRYLRKNGELVWADVTVRLVLDTDGSPRHMLSVVQDITEKVRDAEDKEKLEAQLRQAQKMEALGTLAGGIAHDFNNILGVIIGGAEMLELTEAATPESRDTLANVLGASHRAKDLVKQILAFSRHSRQEKILLNLRSIIKETIEFMRASLPATIQLRPFVDPGSAAIVADPTQMQQVLMNLCTNAAHAMEKEGGTLQVRLDNVEIGSSGASFDRELSAGRYVRLTVSDTGHGMTAAVIQRIFEPYFTTKEKGKGTGLGLAVVHGIVKAHGGSIRVQSEPGKGTTFEVFLPCAQGHAPEAEVRADAAPLPTGSERILLVDDEKALVNTQGRILTLLGYRVQAATDPLEALELFKAAPADIDLVLTDMTMPRMNGLKMATCMRELRPDLPVIICTGFSDRIDEGTARAAGIRALLMKPLMARGLAEAIRAAIDR